MMEWRYVPTYSKSRNYKKRGRQNYKKNKAKRKEVSGK
jgi:hypothetical protein